MEVPITKHFPLIRAEFTAREARDAAPPSPVNRAEGFHPPVVGNKFNAVSKIGFSRIVTSGWIRRRHPRKRWKCKSKTNLRFRDRLTIEKKIEGRFWRNTEKRNSAWSVRQPGNIY
jgi:hypothetical protein